MLTTRDVAEMARCPVCRERPADPCNFLPGDDKRMRRDYELTYHHDRLRAAECVVESYVFRAIRNDIMLHARGIFGSGARTHARHLVMSVWELVVACSNHIVSYSAVT